LRIGLKLDVILLPGCSACIGLHRQFTGEVLMAAINRPARADAPSALRDIAELPSAIRPSSYEMKVAYPEQLFARPFGWWSTLVALCLLLLAPLLLADVPPIRDYPNHLARLFILAQARHDPVPDGIWQPQRAVIPDLVIDLLAPPLTRIMTPFAAGKMMLALASLVPVAGAVACSRAAFGERLYRPMMAGVMAYNIVFVLGFINYLISLGGSLRVRKPADSGNSASRQGCSLPSAPRHRAARAAFQHAAPNLEDATR